MSAPPGASGTLSASVPVMTSARLISATSGGVTVAISRPSLMDCATIGLGVVEADEIDSLNIHWATMKAMTLAVEALGCAPGHVLVDGNRLPRWGFAATAIVGGDAISLSIAAASIVAKHTRDEIMIAHAEAWPLYGWHSNKGYGCAAHLRALREHGPSPLHRRSFAPVAQAVLPGRQQHQRQEDGRGDEQHDHGGGRRDARVRRAPAVVRARHPQELGDLRTVRASIAHHAAVGERLVADEAFRGGDPRVAWDA